MEESTLFAISEIGWTSRAIFPWLRSYICGVAFLDYQHQGLALAGDYPNVLVGRRSLDGVR